MASPRSAPLVSAALCLLCAPAAAAPPNVVVIFADDLGYGDLGCYGATKISTPNIDRLAAEGRRFTDAHAASAVCTPSRYALMTGEYPHREGHHRPVFLKTGLIIDPGRQTVADLMQAAGYATACIGKWHLGFGEGAPDWNGELKPGPLELGFDRYFGVPVVNSHPPFVWVEGHRVVGLVEDDPFVFGEVAKTRAFREKMGLEQIGGAEAAHALYDDRAVGTKLVEEATRWIGEQRGNPFFLYFATTQIHHPFTPAPRFDGSSGCGPYGDFIHELDWMVGELMAALEAGGVADHTLVLFTSDNGGMFNIGGQEAWDAGHRMNGELLGFKFSAWEGGHRVPFIARWPGEIAAGTTSDQLVSNIDLFATLAALTGAEVRAGRGQDSVDILPALTGEPEAPLRDHLVLAPSSPRHLSVRKGKWMFIGAQAGGGFTARKRGEHLFGGPAAITYAGRANSDIEAGRVRPDAPPAQLYDLEADRAQTRNLYREHPEVVAEMRALLKRYTERAPGAAAPPPAAARYDGFEPLGGLRFTFESGRLDGWEVVEGEAGSPVSGHVSLPRWKGRPFNREGRFHLSTIATGDGFADAQQVVLQSPTFVLRGDRASFLASGGHDPESLYVGLFDAATGERLRSAGGARGPQMKRTVWQLDGLRGRAVFLRVVDRNTGGWGHLTFDDFSVAGELERAAE